MEMRAHNRDLMRVREFTTWINMNSKVDTSSNDPGFDSSTIFNWENLLTKI